MSQVPLLSHLLGKQDLDLDELDAGMHGTVHPELEPLPPFRPHRLALLQPRSTWS